MGKGEKGDEKMKDKMWTGGIVCTLFGAIGAIILGLLVEEKTCFSCWAMIIVTILFGFGIVVMITMMICSIVGRDKEFMHKLIYAKMMQVDLKEGLNITFSIKNKNGKVKCEETIECKK